MNAKGRRNGPRQGLTHVNPTRKHMKLQMTRGKLKSQFRMCLCASKAELHRMCLCASKAELHRNRGSTEEDLDLDLDHGNPGRKLQKTGQACFILRAHEKKTRVIKLSQQELSRKSERTKECATKLISS